MPGQIAVPRPHQVNVSLSDEEMENLDYLRGSGTRTSFIRALLQQAKENPESSPVVHKHEWAKKGKTPVTWDKETNTPLFKWVCRCSAHKLSHQKGNADRS